jgi:hypothetical protein
MKAHPLEENRFLTFWLFQAKPIFHMPEHGSRLVKVAATLLQTHSYI